MANPIKVTATSHGVSDWVDATAKYSRDIRHVTFSSARQSTLAILLIYQPP